MQVGDLVYVHNSCTGDLPFMVELFRERTPVLLVRLNGKWAEILDTDGKQKCLRKTSLGIINEAA